MNENAISLAKNSDILISEATFLSKEKDKAIEHKHLTALDASEIAKKTKTKPLLLTHISQRYEHKMHEIEQEAKKHFKSVSLAKNLQTIEI